MNRHVIEAAERLRCHAETAVCTPIIGDLEIVLEELASRVDVQAAIARLKGIYVPPYGEYFADVAMVEADHNARHGCGCGGAAEPVIEPATCPASVSCSDAASPSPALPQVAPPSNQCYQWIGVDFGHRVGRCIELPFVLMLNHHTGEIELVDKSAIQPYPSEPIPEP